MGDGATARMAAMLGDEKDAARFGARANAYRALIDPETHLARGRDSQGHWRTPFDPQTATSPLNNPGDYTEANAWQYSWTPALHDPQGLIEAMGGRATFTAMLDRFFTVQAARPDKFLGQEAMIGQYTHGNEPDQHVPWLYLRSDSPWKAAQEKRRRSCNHRRAHRCTTEHSSCCGLAYVSRLNAYSGCKQRDTTPSVCEPGGCIATVSGGHRHGTGCACWGLAASIAGSVAS